jgi:hypothetical protein
MTKATAQIDALIRKGGSRKKGKTGRKIGRYSTHPSSCRYRSERRWEENQIRRVRRHVRRLPSDEQARSVLARIDPDGESFLAAIPVPRAA